jgi:hypothetical protein
MPAAAEEGDSTSGRLATMAESAAALHRAGHLHEGVTRRLERIDAQTEQHRAEGPPSPRRLAPPDLAQAVSLTRSPRSARQAVVAALILGPPKSLEP